MTILEKMNEINNLTNELAQEAGIERTPISLTQEEIIEKLQEVVAGLEITLMHTSNLVTALKLEVSKNTNNNSDDF